MSSCDTSFTRRWSRIDTGNQDDEAQRSERKERVVAGDKSDDAMWWWLGDADAAPLHKRADLTRQDLKRLDASGGNQINEHGYDGEVDGQVLKGHLAPSERFAALINASKSNDLSEQQHSDSLDASESAENSDGDGSRSSDVSSLSSQSTGSRPHSSYKHEAELKRPSPVKGPLPGPQPSAFASGGVDMMALWLGSDSASLISGESKQESDSTLFDAEEENNSSDQPSSLSRSASVEDLNFTSDSASVSSLSSLSVQSGVCKVSSPRRIENIPVAPVEPATFEDRSRNLLPATYPKCWSYRDFVRPDVPLDQHDHEPRRHRGKPNHEDSRLALKKHMRGLQKAAEDFSDHQLQFVTPVAELFVKFSEVHGIIVDHVPRRHGLFLDVGCGTSSICREMALHGYSNVFGIDIAAAKLDFQRHKCEGLGQFVRFQTMDASELKFRDQLFDCIFTKATLDIVASNYVYEPFINDDLDELKLMLQEIWRCLQPGGMWIVVSCYGSRSANSVGSLNPSDSDASGVEPNERLHKPWWQWKGVVEFIERQYDLVKIYGAGIPLVRLGKRVKPFVVMVYKRKEASNQQRLARLHRTQQDETRREREFVVMVQWHLEKRRWYAEEASIASEARQMVFEDAMARCSEAELLYVREMHRRQAMKAEIYMAILAADRASMTAEDALATALRAEAAALLEFASAVVLEVAASAVAAALVKELKRADALVAIAKEAVGHERANAEVSAMPQCEAFETATGFAVSDSALLVVNSTPGDTEHLIKPPSSSDSLIAENEEAQAAAEVPISMIHVKKSSEKQHVPAQVVLTQPVASGSHPTIASVEQILRVEDGRGSANGATAALCSREAGKGEVAGDSETNATITGESESSGNSTDLAPAAAENANDNEHEAKAIAEVVQPILLTNTQPDLALGELSALSDAEAESEDQMSAISNADDAEKGQDSEDQDRPTAPAVEDLNPSRNVEHVGEPKSALGAQSDREIVVTEPQSCAKAVNDRSGDLDPASVMESVVQGHCCAASPTASLLLSEGGDTQGCGSSSIEFNDTLGGACAGEPMQSPGACSTVENHSSGAPIPPPQAAETPEVPASSAQPAEAEIISRECSEALERILETIANL